MQRKLGMTRLLLTSVFALALSACSTTPSGNSLAESFASQRAEMLSKVVPVKLDGYSILKAKAKGSNIELTMLFTGDAKKKQPDQLFQGMTTRYCNDVEILSMLETGVTYSLLVRDQRGKKILERPITISSCQG